MRQLAELSQSLESLNRFADAEFLELGRSLKTLYAVASKLAGEVGERAESVRENLQQSQLDGEDGFTRRAFEDLERDFAAVTDHVTSLSETADTLKQLIAHGAGMERLAMQLQVSGAGFAIESARTAECRESFGDFVIELRRLASQIAELGGAIGSQARVARRELLETVPVLDRQSEKLRQVTRQSDIAAHNSSEEIRNLLDGSHKALKDAEVQTRRIAAHAEDAVYNLQFGDIVRQKLEHVVAAIGDASRLLDPGDNNQDGLLQSARLLAIQTAQLEAIHAEIGSARRQLSTAFSGMAEEAEELSKTLGRLDGDSRGGPFDRLKGSLTHMSELRDEGTRLLNQADDSSHRAMEAASRLFEYLSQVQEVNYRIQLQALNALIRTERLGQDGLTLGILSTHVHGVFQESRASVDETAAVLEQLRGKVAGEHQSSMAGLPGARPIEEGLSRLDRANTSLAEISRTAAELAQRQHEEFEKTCHRIESLSALDQRMLAMIEQCASLRDQVGGGASGAATEAVSSHGSRYTMESERRVHEQLTNEAAKDSSSEQQPASASQEDQDDNVEFF